MNIRCRLCGRDVPVNDAAPRFSGDHSIAEVYLSGHTGSIGYAVVRCNVSAVERRRVLEWPELQTMNEICELRRIFALKSP